MSYISILSKNTLIIQVFTRTFNILSTMMENKNKGVTNISVFYLRSRSQIIVFIFIFRYST